MGSEMWSEYLPMIERSFQPERNSSSPSRRCSVTLVPRSGRVMVSTSKSPVPSLAPAHALFRLQRRRGAIRPVMRSATMKPRRSPRRTGRSGWRPSLLAFQRGHELARAALGDGAQVGHGFVGADMPMPLSRDGDRSWPRRRSHAHFEVRRVLEQLSVVQRLEAQLVAGVRGVGDQLCAGRSPCSSTASA